MKKLITVLGLLLIPLSFTSAADTGPSCIEYDSNSTNVVYGNTILTFDNGNFATQRGSESIQNVMWLTRNNFDSASNKQGYWLSSAFGYINGLPYIYAGSYTDSYQGYPENVCVESLDTFDLATFGSNTSCNSQEISTFLTNKNIVGGGYCYPKTDNDHANAKFTYCFYDSTNAYCFKISSYGGNTPSSRYLTLSGSIGLTTPLTPTKLLNVEWGPSPFTESTTPTQPDTNGVCITVQQLFDMQSNNYNTGLCYSANKYLTQTGRIEVTPKFITELYPTYTELRQDRNTRQNYCQPPATQQTCQTAFSGKEENRTLLNKIPTGTDLTVLYDYCYTYQTRSGNMEKNFCDMTPEEQRMIRPSTMTTEGYAERIAKNPTTTTTPLSGSVYDGLTDGTNRDIIETIPRVYTKITGIFKGRTGKDGIIPYYITGILLVIVLFKLFKK